MRRISWLLTSILVISTVSLWAQDIRDKNKNKQTGNAPAPHQTAPRQPAPARPAPVLSRPPVVINMNRGTSGGHNRNYPSQQPAPQPVQRPAQQPNQGTAPAQRPQQQPSYGQLHWNAPAAQQPQRHQAPAYQPVQPWAPTTQGRVNSRPNPQPYRAPGVNAAVAVHHHAYTQGYVRKKLQKMGVSAEPNVITDRAEMIHTDRAHSIIAMPRDGFDHQPIGAMIVSPRHFNDPVVRDQMHRLEGADWGDRINGLCVTENMPGRYYWHQDNGFNFCHYLDGQGYHWWGWYAGNQYFWTRYYGSRWWWYDSDNDRWCFWNNSFWWWQDPYHVGDLYCYNNDTYIPCNSAEDQVVVTAPVVSNEHDINSPDGTRVVKLFSDSQDAFLYDTADPPTFDPVYLASGVKSVSYSDVSNGRPLQIILTLNDGSYDMFDNYGNPYNPGANDADQATQDDGQGQGDTPNPPVQ